LRFDLFPRRSGRKRDSSQNFKDIGHLLEQLSLRSVNQLGALLTQLEHQRLEAEFPRDRRGHRNPTGRTNHVRYPITDQFAFSWKRHIPSLQRGTVSEIITFTSIQPSPENYFRSIVLFGRNVASYKFALAKTILRLANEGRQDVPLSDLAPPFATEICRHLNIAPKQATSASSRFLDVCCSFNAGEISESELIETTTRLGFANVIDAFHVVGPGDIPIRFFTDQRNTNRPGITLTDELLELAPRRSSDLDAEAEARWRLVETAWELGTSRATISFDANSGALTTPTRRRSVTSATHALTGYQRGKCFYCYRSIGLTQGSTELADIDHVFPHVLARLGLLSNIDGIWNLVLACPQCNRGPSGKFDYTPAALYIERLHRRNEYLISSHHPLRETLMMQTGTTAEARRAHLQAALNVARQNQVATWTTAALDDPAF
jgi:5-methylcytosine-specific restriction endonuclease McrA